MTKPTLSWCAAIILFQTHTDRGMPTTLSICWCIWQTLTQPLNKTFSVIQQSTVKEMLFHTWAELTVVSDIMGQKLFLILMFGPLAQFAWLNTSRPSSSLFNLSVSDQVLQERLIVRKETVFNSATEMTPLMFKDAFWVSPFLSSHALLKL